MLRLTRLAVYCGSASGNDPAFTAATRELGQAMAAADIGLVYGGGRLGLMGVVADTILAAGGRAHGVIPEALVPHEVAHSGLDTLETVADMHQRKARMTELADAFICLPGGIGTLDELFEGWTGQALGYHAKPLCLLNVGGFWDGLVSFIDQLVADGFLSPARRAQLLVASDAADALEQVSATLAAANPGVTW